MAKAKTAATKVAPAAPTARSLKDVKSIEEFDQVVEAVTATGKRPRKPAEPVTITLPTIQPKEERAIQKQATDICINAATIAKHINSAEDEQHVADYRNEVIKPGLAEVDKIFKPILKAQKDAYDTSRSAYNTLRGPFEQADRLLLDATVQWRSRLAREHDEAQRLAQEQQKAATLKAASERADRYLQIQAEVDSQLEELSVAEGLSDEEIEALMMEIRAPLVEFEDLLQRPLTVVQVQVSAPEVSGAFSLQDNWRGEILERDTMTVLKQVVAGELPLSIIEFRQPELNKLAALYQDKKQFPGVRFYNQPFVRGNSGKK